MTVFVVFVTTETDDLNLQGLDLGEDYVAGVFDSMEKAMECKDKIYKLFAEKYPESFKEFEGDDCIEGFSYTGSYKEPRSGYVSVVSYELNRYPTRV